MKKIFLILGGITVVAILIGIGWIAGFQSKFFEQAYSINLLDQRLTELSIKELLLHEIQSGKIDDAKDLIRTEQDGDILLVDSLIDSADERSRDLARKVFTRIAHDRVEFSQIQPTNNSMLNPKDEAEINAKIDSILKRASEPAK
jgi:hypothetical protein